MSRHTTASTHFSADWLHLREPFDAAARDAAAPGLALESRLARWRHRAGLQEHEPLRIIDLGCGTGANLRWLAPRLGGAQQWLVVDHDAALLRRWPVCLAAASLAGGVSVEPGGAAGGSRRLRFRGPGFSAEIVRRRLDLVSGLETLPWHAAHLITGSALIDLPGVAWLERLVAATADAGAALLMALSVDGRHRWAPADPDDACIADLFAAHQRRDKGFGGAALGPAGAPALAQALRQRGYRVFSARSDWIVDGPTALAFQQAGASLDGSEAVGAGVSALALQRALIDGMASAAEEQSPASAARVLAWQQRRQASTPRTVLRVGHLDVLALPPPGSLPSGRPGRPGRADR